MSLFPGRSSSAASSVYDSGATLSGSAIPWVYCQRVPSNVRTFFRSTSRVSAPGAAQSFFVGIPVLGHDGGDPIGVSHRQTEPRRCAIVEYVERISFELECLREGLDRPGQCVERISV